MTDAARPEQLARREIDRLLAAAGWAVQDVASADLAAARGVAIREFPLLPGHGLADYLLYVEAKACGVIEAKKQGATLTGVEAQSARYAQGLPPSLPAWQRPLPFVYESTGIETHFTNGLDPAPRCYDPHKFGLSDPTYLGSGQWRLGQILRMPRQFRRQDESSVHLNVEIPMNLMSHDVLGDIPKAQCVPLWLCGAACRPPQP